MDPGDDQDEFLTDEELARRRAMAGGAPGVGSVAPGAPAVQVPQQPAPAAPKIAMPAQAAAPAVSAGVIAPAKTQLAQDQAEQQRLQTTGSGVHQFGENHHILGPILKALDIAGSIISPRLAVNIPGTTMHHEGLLAQNRRQIGGDIQQQQEQAETANQQEQLTEAPQKLALEDRKQTLAEQNANQPKPKEESWEVMPGFQGPNGEPILYEKNSGQQRLATAVPGAKVSKQPNTRPDTPEQQAIDYYTTHGKTLPQAIQQYAKDTQKPERDPAGGVGTWALDEDAQGKPIMFNSKTAETKAAPQNINKPGTYEKRFGPARDAVQYASDYMEGKNFTGPGDEALMEKFFEVAKPSTGFRMSQPQQNMLMETRDAYQGIVARGKHLLSPNAPYFDDTQRANIVKTMNDIVAAKEHAGGQAPAQSKQQPANNDPLGIR